MNGFMLLDFLFFTEPIWIRFFTFCRNIKRNKMYKRCTASNAGAKFNMKHSLKTLDLQHSRQSPAEHRPLRTTHRQPPSAPPAASRSFFPAPPPHFSQKQLHTRNHGSVKHGSLRNFPDLHQICHNAHV